MAVTTYTITDAASGTSDTSSLNWGINAANNGGQVVGTFGTGTINLFEVAAADSIGITISGSASLTLDGDTYSLEAAPGSATYADLTLSTGTLTIESMSIANFTGGAAISLATNTTVIFQQGSATNDVASGTTNIGVISAPIVGGGNVQVGNALDGVALPLIFNANNTYTGVTTINDTLELGALGQIASSAAVNLATSASILDVSEVESAGGAAGLGSAGPLTVGAPLTGVGQLVVQNLTGVAGSQVFLGNNGLTVNETNSAGTTFAGTFEDGNKPVNPGYQSSSLNVEGSGTFTIVSEQDYSGSTRIYGHVALGGDGDGSIADSSNVSLKAAGASLTLVTETSDPTYCIQELTGVSGTFVNLGNNTLIVSEDLTNANYTGAITGTSSATFELSCYGDDTLTLNGAGDFSNFAGTVVDNGSLALAGAAAIDVFVNLNGTGSLIGAHCVVVNGSLDVSAVTGFSGTVTLEALTGDGCVYLGSNTLVVDYGATSGSSTFCGDISGTGGLQVGESSTVGAFTRGELVLAGDNCYTGSTKIYGELVLGDYCSIADSSNVALKVAGAALDVSCDGATINELSGVSGTFIYLGCEDLTVTMDMANANFAGVISGGYGSSLDIEAVCSGTTYTLTLTGVNTYEGCTYIASGASLSLSGIGSIADSQELTVNGTFNVAGVSGPTDVIVNNLSGCDTSASIVLGANTLEVGLGCAYSSGGFTYSEFDGVISGTGGLMTVANGSGLSALVLGNNETYTGETTIGSGTALVLLSNSIDHTSTVLVQTDGVLVFEADDTFTPTIQGGGSVYIGYDGEFGSAIVNNTDETSGSSGPTVTLTAVETYEGETYVDYCATLVLGANASIADSADVYVNGTLDLSGVGGETSTHVLINQLTGDSDCALVDLGNNTLEITASGTCYYDGVISGTGGVQVDANATLSLADSDSTYTGGTLVYGTLNLSDDASLASANVTLETGAVMNVYDGYASSINELIGQVNTVINLYSDATLSITETSNASFAGLIQGEGNLEIASGSGTLTLLGVPETYTGWTEVDTGGSLALSGNSSISDSYNVEVNGTLDVSGVTTSGTTTIQELNGSGHVVLGAINMVDMVSDESFSGVISGSGGFTAVGETSGSGSEPTSTRLTLSGNNTFTGGLDIQGGTVEISSLHGAGSGSITFAGSTTSNLGVLQIDNSALSGVGTGGETFATAIVGSSIGVAGNATAIIDLPGLTFEGGSSESAVNYSGALNTLTITEGAVNVTLTVGPMIGTSSISAYEDSHGGTFIVFDTTGSAAFDASHYHP